MRLLGISVLVLPLGPSHTPGGSKSSPAIPSHTFDDEPVLSSTLELDPLLSVPTGPDDDSPVSAEVAFVVVDAFDDPDGLDVSGGSSDVDSPPPSSSSPSGEVLPIHGEPVSLRPSAHATNAAEA